MYVNTCIAQHAQHNLPSQLDPVHISRSRAKNAIVHLHFCTCWLLRSKRLKLRWTCCSPHVWRAQNLASRRYQSDHAAWTSPRRRFLGAHGRACRYGSSLSVSWSLHLMQRHLWLICADSCALKYLSCNAMAVGRSTSKCNSLSLLVIKQANAAKPALVCAAHLRLRWRSPDQLRLVLIRLRRHT